MPASEIPNRETVDAWIWNGNVPSLHGLRAVSIIAVIASHTFQQARMSGLWTPISGKTGVDIFFVISGFLITLLLLREQERTGRISLRNFYLRRFLRIFPAYYFFLSVMLCLTLAGVMQLQYRDLGLSAIYMTNLMPPSMFAPWDIAHSWSLCVEEHFYIVWPLVLILCGRKLAFAIAVSYIVATPCLRYLLSGSSQFTLWAFTPVRADTMACGCCLAIVATSPKWRPRISMPPLLNNILILVCFGELVISNRVWTFPIPRPTLDFYMNNLSGTVDAIFIMGLIWGCISHPTGAVGMALNSRVAVFIGTLSYSLYLWQQPFFRPDRYQENVLFQVPLNMIGPLLIATCSYYFIEARFLAYKSRLARIDTTAAPAVDLSGAVQA